MGVCVVIVVVGDGGGGGGGGCQNNFDYRHLIFKKMVSLCEIIRACLETNLPSKKSFLNTSLNQHQAVQAVRTRCH